MNRSVRFRVNTPRVVHQTIDGEVVIINLESGSYYSLDRVAAQVWALLERGLALDETAEPLARRYDADPGTIDRAVEEFVSRLCDEGLLVPSADPPAAGVSAETEPAGAGRTPFEPPALQKYTDMQDLLLIDPIHEVDGLGWPGVKTDPGR